MDRIKFDDIYSEEVNIYSRKENISYSQALDKLWTEFIEVEFDEKVYDKVTLVKLLW